jgi:hypothetical protein
MTMATRGRRRCAAAAVAGALGVLAAAAPLGAQPGALPPAREVLDRWARTIGGREAVLALTSARAHATLEDTAAGMRLEAEYLNLAPNLSRVTMRFPGGATASTGYNGSVGWEATPAGAARIEGTQLQDLADESVLHRFLYDSSTLRLAETTELREVDGIPCHHVRVVWKSGREAGACFAVETGLRVAVYRLDPTPMGRVETVEVHEDYRPVGGVLTPMRIRFRARGTETVITFHRVEYNVPLERSLFDPPPQLREAGARSP